MAGTVQRPSVAPKPHVTRTALPAGLLAGATLLIAIVFMIGPGSRSNQPATSGSPTASATASSSASASSPTASASQVAGIRVAAAVASVPNCDITGITHTIIPVVSGGDMFIECALSDSGRQIVARVNLTTNQLVQTYATYMGNGTEHGFAVAGRALWIQIDNGSGCSSPCTGYFHVFRIDLVSGNVTRDLVDRSFVGVDSSYVLVADLSGHVFKLDPATGDSKGQIPEPLDTADDACGSLWGIVWGIDGTGTATTVTRLDPETGNVLASFTEPGTVGPFQQIGNECWAVAYTGQPAYPLNPDDTTVYRFIRITPSGIDFRSPTYPTGTRAEIFDGTFWTLTVGAVDPNMPALTNSNLLTTMQRIDPATWQPTGTIWTYTGDAPAFAAGGSLWAAQAGLTSPALNRLDVPLGPIGS